MYKLYNYLWETELTLTLSHNTENTVKLVTELPHTKHCKTSSAVYCMYFTMLAGKYILWTQAASFCFKEVDALLTRYIQLLSMYLVFRVKKNKDVF